ncbi:MAG: dicarboxylate/amino acid:cation symporter [Lachnospiraceae bacterium]|nr:dicarboxylate/amino acid:cation symporter [Lachnospiraceae bacterium]
MTEKTIILTRSNIDEVMVRIGEVLTELKVKPKSFLVAQLLVEEVFLQLEIASEGMDDFSAEIRVLKHFGNVDIILIAPGKKGVSLNLLDVASAKDENYANLVTLNAYKKQLRFFRQINTNIAIIKLQESEMKQTRRTLLGMAGGFILGALLKQFINDPEQLAFIEDNFLTSIQTMYMNALIMIAAPQIFFSILSGITNISSTASLEKIGSRLILCSVPKSGLYIAIGLFIGHMIGAISAIPAMIAGDDAIVRGNIIREMIIDIIPGNIVTPFYTNNVLQLLFVACVSGVVLSRAGDWSSWAKEGINFFNRFLSAIMDIILPFIPVAVLVSTAKLMIHTGLDALLSYGKIILASAIGIPVAVLISSSMIFILGRLSPFPFVKKIIGFIPLPFSLSNSTACMPAAMSFCDQKLGMDQKFTGLSIPLGMQINMDGTGYYVAIVSMVLAHTFGININFDFCLTMFIALIMINLTGMGLIAMPSIYMSFGIPQIAVAMVIGIEPILDMFGTAQSVLGNITSSFLVCRGLKQVDEKVYFGE